VCAPPAGGGAAGAATASGAHGGRPRARAAGLFWQADTSPWFSVRAALSAAFTSLLYVDSGLADAGTAAQLEAFAKTQLDYALGAPAPRHALGAV
jgi:hypothetical protein